MIRTRFAPSLILLLLATFNLPVSAQEATPEAIALPLRQIYTNEVGTATFSYPPGWVILPYPSIGELSGGN